MAKVVCGDVPELRVDGSCLYGAERAALMMRLSGRVENTSASALTR
jgi:hypothetical protein